MRYPCIIDAYEMNEGAYDDCQAKIEGVGWVPARPMGFASLSRRVKAAWMVFAGRADALIWPRQET